MYDLLEDHDYTTRMMYKELPFNHLLSDSFNGNRISVMIGCCSKDINDVEDTEGTLTFAESVMTVKNDKLDNLGNIQSWWQLYIQPQLAMVNPLKLMVDPLMTFKDIKNEISLRTGLDYDTIQLKEKLDDWLELDDDQNLIDNPNIGMGSTIYVSVQLEALDTNAITTLVSPRSIVSI